MTAFENFSDSYWRRVRFLKCIEPWRDCGFSWAQLIHSMPLLREEHILGKPRINEAGATSSPRTQRGERGPESPRSTPPPALAISFDRSAQWPES